MLPYKKLPAVSHFSENIAVVFEKQNFIQHLQLDILENEGIRREFSTSFLLLQFPVFLSFPSADHVALQPVIESYVLSEAFDFVIVYRNSCLTLFVPEVNWVYLLFLAKNGKGCAQLDSNAFHFLSVFNSSLMVLCFFFVIFLYSNFLLSFIFVMNG